MIRDRDRIYGAVVTRRLRAMGIRDKPIAPASPWQNGFGAPQHPSLAADELRSSCKRSATLTHPATEPKPHTLRIDADVYEGYLMRCGWCADNALTSMASFLKAHGWRAGTRLAYWAPSNLT